MQPFRLISLSLVLFSSSAHAQLPELRRALSDYGNRAGVLAAIRGADPSEHQGRAQSEVKFLRAAVAADLLLLDALNGDASADLAEALGEDDAKAHVRRELSGIGQEPYASPARDLVAAIALLDAEPAPLDGRTGIRQDVVLLHRIASALSSGEDLGAWAQSPCTRRCPSPFDRLQPSDRRELSAISQAVLAGRRAEQAAEHDPLVRRWLRSLRGEITLLRGARIPISLRFAQNVCLSEVPSVERGAAGSPDMIVWLGREPLVGFGRFAGVSAEGEPRLMSAQQPSLESPTALGESGAVIQEALRRRRGLTVGFAVQEGATAFDLSRAVGSLRTLGVRRFALLACADGNVRAVRMSDAAEPRVRVLIRNSGLDVSVVGERRRLESDFEALQSAVGVEGPVQLRARRSIAARKLVELAFASAHEGSVDLALP